MKFFAAEFWNEKLRKFLPAQFTIRQGRFDSLTWGKPVSTDREKRWDLSGLKVGPPATDLHVHSRDFEETHKETFERLEAQALRGGVARLVCMANTFPRLDTERMIRFFLKRVHGLRVDVYPLAAVSENLEGKRATDWANLLKLPTAGLSDDGKPIRDPVMMEGALRATKKAGKILSLHEEDLSISEGSVMALSKQSLRRGLPGSPAASEAFMVARDLALAKKTNAHVHFGHLSSREAVALLGKARQEGVSFSAELTPHHGLLSVEDSEKLAMRDLSLFKVCPVIRKAEDRQALWEAVRRGLIDCFATDHAPHSHLEKCCPMEQAAHGIVALENYYPLYGELRERAALSWAQFFRNIDTRPRGLLAAVLQKNAEGSFGSLGSLADFVVFEEGAVAKPLSWALSGFANTPLKSMTARLWVREHYRGGQLVYKG